MELIRRMAALALALVTLMAGAATATATSATAQVSAQVEAGAQADDDAEVAAFKCDKKNTITLHNSGNYLNVEGGIRKGARIITWPWSGKPNEKWCLERGPEGSWYFHPGTSKSLCLDVPGAKYKQGTGLIIWTCNKRKNQRFFTHPVILDSGVRVLVLVPAGNRSLKVHASASPTGPVSLWKHVNANVYWL